LHSLPFETGTASAAEASVLSPLVLDLRERRLRGVDMPQLLKGELLLLAFLGSRAFTWNPSQRLAALVYHREDRAGRQLVWKYASTLRKKLAPAAPGLIELCRLRGYRCRAQVAVLGLEVEPAAPRPEPALVTSPG
jgi:DNA-binding response OmpR family regulator